MNREKMSVVKISAKSSPSAFSTFVFLQYLLVGSTIKVKWLSVWVSSRCYTLLPQFKHEPVFWC